MKELMRRGVWSLWQYEKDFFQFGSDNDFRSAWGVPVNQAGTAAELTGMLENWIRIDERSGNTEMMGIEKRFLQCLQEVTNGE